MYANARSRSVYKLMSKWGLEKQRLGPSHWPTWLGKGLYITSRCVLYRWIWRRQRTVSTSTLIASTVNGKSWRLARNETSSRMPVCPAKTSQRWLSPSSFVDAISSTSSTSLCDVIFYVTRVIVTPTSSVLRHQRHYAFADDKRPVVIHLLLYSGAEGPDRRRRPTQLPYLPAERRRQHS